MTKQIILDCDPGHDDAVAIMLAAASKEIELLKLQLEEILARHTGQDVEKIHTDTDRDFVLTAPEALEYGIIDEVIEERPLVDNSGPISAVK